MGIDLHGNSVLILAGLLLLASVKPIETREIGNISGVTQQQSREVLVLAVDQLEKSILQKCIISLNCY